MSFTGEMASTPSGRAWAIKALHPSDPITEVVGLPDESSCPSVVLHYNQVYRIVPPLGLSTSSWGFNLTVLPNVIVPGCVDLLDGSGNSAGKYNFLNQAFRPPGVPNPSYLQLRRQFQTLGIEAHRLLYMGVTGYQDGPALANQGTLVAAQWEVARRKMSTTSADNGLVVQGTRGAIYDDTDFADYATSQFMPNAYFGESKDGVYLPLKVTSTCQKWTTDADLEGHCGGWPYAMGDEDAGWATPTVAQGIGNGFRPYPSLERRWWSVPGPGWKGDLVYKPLNGIWGGISVRNLSPQTSFAFYVRLGIEARVTPSSMLASNQRMSPPYDPVALSSYFRINRELKDAYPADFNDLGKIWEVIKNAARVALPIVGGFGPVGAAIAGLGNAIIGPPKQEETKPATRAADQPPAATVERIQDRQKVIDAAPMVRSMPPTRVKRQGVKLKRKRL